MTLLDWIFWTLTVYMEAEGETADGKLAVAWTIWNRARRRGQSVLDTVLAPRQFSCWDTLSARRMVLDQLNEPAFQDSLRAVAAARFGLQPDPTRGATHYLNVDLVLREAGRLPAWATGPGGSPTEVAPAAWRAQIGRHTFLDVV